MNVLSKNEAMKARLNPFASNRVLQIRYELQQETWERLLQRLAGLSYRAAIIGPEGSGKTTLLEDLAERLQDQFRVKWLRDDFSQTPQDHLILVDGVDLFSPLRQNSSSGKREPVAASL